MNQLDVRTGFGYDIHRLVEGNGKILFASVPVVANKIVEAHSDGDVVLHSLSNALFSSIGKNDIGYYFPDTIDETKGMSSIIIVQKALQIIREYGYRITSVTIDIVLEQPKLSSYREAIRKSLSSIINVEESRIAVHFNTGEKIGEIGQGKAIVVYSQVCILKDGL